MDAAIAMKIMDDSMGLDPVELNHYYEIMVEQKTEQLFKCMRENSRKDEEILSLRSQQKELTSTISSLNANSLKLQQITTENSRIMLDQDKKIQLYLKSISDSRNNCKELQETIAKVEKENLKMQMQEKEIMQEFVKLKSIKDFKIMDTSRKLSSAYKESRRQMLKINDLEVYIRRFKSDLQHCIGFIQEPKQFKETVKHLYANYVRPSDWLDPKSLDDELNIIQHSELLQKTITALKVELTNQRTAHHDEKDRIIKENMQLMDENIKLRKELKSPEIKVLASQREKGGKQQYMDCRVRPMFSTKKPPAKKNEMLFMPAFIHIKKLEKRPGGVRSLQLPTIRPAKSA